MLPSLPRSFRPRLTPLPLAKTPATPGETVHTREVQHHQQAEAKENSASLSLSLSLCHVLSLILPIILNPSRSLFLLLILLLLPPFPSSFSFSFLLLLLLSFSFSFSFSFFFSFSFSFSSSSFSFFFSFCSFSFFSFPLLLLPYGLCYPALFSVTFSSYSRFCSATASHRATLIALSTLVSLITRSLSFLFSHFLSLPLTSSLSLCHSSLPLLLVLLSFLVLA